MQRWLRRLVLVLLSLVLALLLASAAFNAATAGREQPARQLYPGPFVRVAGTLVAYRSWGSSGTPVVLLGGAVEPSWVWRKVGPLLARDHRVFALDLPPFGYTARNGRYRLRDWVELLRGFDRVIGVHRPLVVGHSLGAAVAVDYALHRPREVSGIVLLDGDALAAGGAAHWVSHLVVGPLWTSAFRLATGSDWIARRLLREAWGLDPPRFDRATVAAWQRPFRVAGTAAAFRQMIRYGLQGVRTRDLRRVRVPRLVVWGEHDTVDEVAAGRAAAAALRARFVVIPRAGHLSMLANAPAVARALERVP